MVDQHCIYVVNLCISIRISKIWILVNCEKTDKDIDLFVVPVWKTGKPGMRSSNTFVGELTIGTTFLMEV